MLIVALRPLPLITIHEYFNNSITRGLGRDFKLLSRLHVTLTIKNQRNK